MKRSLVRLFVAVITLAAALVELAVRVVQFTILLVERLTNQLTKKDLSSCVPMVSTVPTVAAAPVTTNSLPTATTAAAATVPTAAPVASLTNVLALVPKTKSATSQSDAERRLIGALTGPSLGFPVRSARAFAATVRARLVTEPIDGLVREGIAKLSVAS